MTAKKTIPKPLALPCASEDYPAVRQQRRMQRLADLPSEEDFDRHMLREKLAALRRIELGNEIVETICLAYRVDSSRPYKDEETGEDRDLRTDVINEVLSMLWKSDATFPKRGT